MKKIIHGFLPMFLTLSLTLFLTTKGEAQYEDELEDIAGHWEAGIAGGANAFFGDLGGNKGAGKPFIKDFNSKTTRPLVGLYVDYFKYSWLSFKLALNYTNVDGADSLIKNSGDLERWRYYRNLSFRSRIWEASVNAEVYPVMIFEKEMEIHKISPYVGLGLGVFHFNPQTKYDNQWINLRDLHTEGEGFPGIDTATKKPFPNVYHRLQVFIPITLGVKIYLTNTYAISAGVTFRHTFTDYIDDISTYYIPPGYYDKYLPPAQAYLAKQLYWRSITPYKPHIGYLKANPNDNDSYTNLFITLSIRFGNGPKFYYGG